MKKRFILFSLLFLEGLIPRLFYLTKTPPLFSDEIHIVNAVLSYLEKGKDINGKVHPFFYDLLMYTSPLMGISMISSFLILGMNPFTIRLPAVIYSLGAIFVLYSLSSLLTKNFLLSFLTAFLFTFIPWHFHYSRIGWEPASFLFYFSFLTFGLSFYTYSTALFFVPLFFLFLILLFFKEFKKDLKPLVLGEELLLIIITPFIFLFLKESLTYQRPANIFLFKKIRSFKEIVFFSFEKPLYYFYKF